MLRSFVVWFLENSLPTCKLFARGELSTSLAITFHNPSALVIDHGDFIANFQRPDTGINTVEGNVAGSRAATLSKKRLAEQAEFEARKSKIQKDSERGKLRIDANFDTNTNVKVQRRGSFDRKPWGWSQQRSFERLVRRRRRLPLGRR